MIDNSKIQKVYADMAKVDQSKKDSNKKNVSHNDLLSGNDRIQKVIIAAAKAQIEANTINEPRVDVKNFPKSFRTPDIESVVTELKKLNKDLTPLTTDFTPVIKALQSLENKISKLPTEYPEMETVEAVTVKNAEPMQPLFKSLEKTIKAIKVDPKITLNEKEVNIDLSSMTELLEDIKNAVAENKVLIPETDNTEVIKALDNVYLAIENLSFPVPNFILPFKDSDGKATQVKLDNNGNVPISNGLHYAINDKEATATYKYFGFQRSDAYWYIMRKTIATNKFEYVAGSSAYATAWTNRASQIYTDYATAF